MEKIDRILNRGRHVIALGIMVALSVLILFYFFVKVARPLSADHPRLSLAVMLIVGLVCLCGIAAYVMLIILKTDKLKTYIVFLMIIAAVMSIVIPQNTVPDEMSHFTTAYYYSNMLMGVKNETGTGRKGLSIRKCDWDNLQPMISAEKYQESFGDFKVFADDNERMDNNAIIFINSSPFYAYIPQTLGLTLGQLLHLSGTLTYYTARFFNLAFYLFALYFAIKKIPFGKTAMAIIGLFPVAVQQAASLSTDSFINAVAFLLIASGLKMIYSDKEIKMSEIIPFAVLSVLLAPCKLVYFAIPFMILLIPKQKIDSKRLRLSLKFLMPALSVAALVLFEFSNISKHLDNQTSGTAFSEVPTYPMSYIFTDTARFVLLILHTLRESFHYYVVTMISSYLGSLQIMVSGFIFAIFLILLFMGLIPEKKEIDLYEVKESHKLLYFVIFAGTSFLAMLSMFTAWTPSNSLVILGVQGRYFLPVLPLIIPICYTKKITAEESVGRYALFGGICLSFYTIISVLGRAAVL